MARKKKKKKKGLPKPRHTWGINPKTRVKKSAKKYRRPRAKKEEKSWFDEIDW